jgi:hypothetical protein
MRQAGQRMSSTERHPGAAPVTEITVSTGERYRVEGDANAVERAILDAARGSIMQLAWMIEAETAERIAINPEHVVALRSVDT